MARIISFANRKGGVGKTTSAINIAAGLARIGKKVLLIDLDPQGNLTHALADEPSNTIFTLLMKECELQDALIQINSNLVLIGCNPTFARFEKQFAGEADGLYILNDFLEDVLEQAGDQIDIVILDCPPSLGLITINAMVASHEVYVPMEAQQFSLEGLNQVRTEVEKIQKRANPKLKLKGLFFSRHNARTYISKNMVELLENEYPGLLMNTFIRRNIALEESPSLKQDIFTYAPESNGAKDYESLVNEILK